MRVNLRYTSKELAFITVISALGAIMSVQIGYLGNYLKTLPLLPLGTGQILSGLHLIPLIISGLYIEKRWVITTTSTVKGLLEAVLFSFHGLPVILMSIFQGMLIDLTLITIGDSKWSICLGCGLASISNVAFLQFFLLLPFPRQVFIFMYLLSFSSGIIFGGYGGKVIYKMINTRLSINNQMIRKKQASIDQFFRTLLWSLVWVSGVHAKARGAPREQLSPRNTCGSAP